MNANRASRKPRVPLALSKGYYQSAFQHAEAALAMLDLDLTILDANDRCCQLLAQPKEAIIGIRLDTLFSSDTDVFIPQLRQAIEQNTEAHFAASAVLKAGNKIPLSAQVRRLDAGKETPVLLSLGEVSNQQEAEDSRRESERQFRAMADIVPVMIWQSGLDKLYGYFNKQWLDFTGRRLDEELGNGWADGVHPDDLSGCLDTYYAAFDARQDFQMEYRLRRYTGEYRWILDKGTPFFSPDGFFTGYIGSCIDITDLKQTSKSLRDNQKQLASIIASAMDAIITVDSEQRIILFNAAAEKMFRCHAEAAIGRPLEDFIPERFRATHEDHVRRFAETNTTSRSMGGLSAISGLRADGEEFPIEASISQVEINFRKLFTIIIRDITLRRQAEDVSHEALAASERQRAQLEAVFQTVADGIVIADLKGNFILINEAEARINGYASAAEMKRDLAYFAEVYELAYLDGRPLPVQEWPLSKLLRGESVSDWELRARRRDTGREWVFNFSGEPVYDEAGRQILAVVVTRDITERKRSEAQLREQATLLDQATDAILVKSLDDRILYWNKGAERIYGWAAAEAVGRHIHDLYLKQPSQGYDDAKRLLLEKGDWSGEFQHLHKSGKKLTIDVRWTLVRDPEGQPKSVLVINTDVTEKKRLEAQFLRAQRMESIGTLAGGIAHDLNNILSPILTALGLLDLRFPDPESRRMISVLKECALRGSGLISQVLSFARGVEGDRVILQPKHLIKEVIKILKDTLPKTIDIGYSLSDGLWPVLGDATQIHQVLMNLLINARDALPHGGKIIITTSNVKLDENYARMNPDATPGRYACISITDTGTGIPAAAIEKIFDPFFTTKEMGKGTGLGLSTVLTIVKSHGGFITVYSEVGKGSEFKVYLPAAESMVAEETAGDEVKLPVGHGELILVVDDESAIREITRSTLETYGYEVLTAGDGTEAVALIAQHRDNVKMLLTDVRMPYMDGPATIRVARKMNPEIKVIISSGLKTNEKEMNAASVGAHIFLSKPYTADKLLRAIAGLLGTN